ncbi:hypothetical protein BKH45_06870 [Helicobacter sp. 11S03491-1]|nr:hypothetical protein BKH45_06870 [Helicobacter sp. 11S03491-1]
MHGIIKHRDDPFWKNNYPPNGFNCACRVFAYTKEQLQDRGWEAYTGELPDIAQKGFKGDSLADANKELEKIYREKAKRVAGINAPSKLIKAAILADYGRILENQKRWKEVKGLYDNPVIDKKIVIAHTSVLLQDLLHTQTKEIFLSAETLVKQKQKHKELGAFDYYLISHMGIKPLYKFADGDYSVVFVEKLGNKYRIVYKVTQDRKEVYVTSFLKYSKEDEKDFNRQIEKFKRNKKEIRDLEE